MVDKLCFYVVLFLTLFCSSSTFAQTKSAISTIVVQPREGAISHNIVFVIDASSTINRYEDAKLKFDVGWDFITEQFGSDEIYFCIYIFHDMNAEKKFDWAVATQEELTKAKEWIKSNTGTYSWGLKALRMGLREQNPLDKNPVTAKTSTVVLMTDGGFTEAADGYGDDESILEKDIENHKYSRTGKFDVINKMIEKEQLFRKLNDLAESTILTIGVENTDADKVYGTSVKRPDNECQEWLKLLGERYHGGYIYIHN